MAFAGKPPIGANWTYQSQLATTTWGALSHVTSIAWNGSVFCIGGENNAGLGGSIATSADGVTWTYQNGLKATGPTGWAGGSVYDLIWTGSQFCVVGQDAGFATSPDGVTWTYRAGLKNIWPASYRQVFSVAWNGSVFCAVGLYGNVATSADGITWTLRTGLQSTSWSVSVVWKVIWVNSQFIAVGAGGVATSPDGITWTVRNAIAYTLWNGANGNEVRSIAWSGTQYCIVGESGQVATSPDAITWTNQTGLRATDWGTTDSVRSIVWALSLIHI
jgi:hypothetical protein